MSISEMDKDFAALHAEQLSDWSSPDEIQNELMPVEPFAIDMLPEALREFVADEAERMQAPPDFIAISLIAVISAVIGAGCCIKPKKEDDWMVFPNLWGCIVGRPGKLKSPAASVAISMLDKLEAKEKEAYEKALIQHEDELEFYEIEKSALKSKLASSVKNSSKADIGNLKNHYSNLPKPEKPKRKRYKSNDATVEKLSELLSENHRGLMLYRDELMGLLTSWEKAGRESDRAFFLEAWNGTGAHTCDRIGRGTIDTANLCVSVFGTTQPDKIARYLYSAIKGNNDGLLQRFQLLVFPDDIEWKLVDRKPNSNAKDMVFEIIKKLSTLDFVDIGAEFCEGNKYPFFRFDEDSQKVFYDWLTQLEICKLQSDDHALIIEHLSKYRKLMPALALIFHLVDIASGHTSVSVATQSIQQAIRFVAYLETHARRVYSLATDIESQAAAILSKKIKAGSLKNGFTLRDVYRKKGLLAAKEIAKAACDELIDANWIREVIMPTAKGLKQKITYLINPRLFIR